MAIDITKGSHIESFPSKIASMMGQFSHVYNIVLTADTDNGTLAGRGDYVSFDQYEQDAVPAGFKGKVLERGADGRWLVEVTELPAAEVLYIYNAPVSEYAEKELQDESLFFSKAGEVVQGAVLIVGDVFSLSDKAFTNPTAVAAAKTVTFANGKYTAA